MECQWKRVSQAKKLNKILNALENYLKINGNIIIIPNNYKELIDNQLLQGLSKPFYLYKNTSGICFLLESEYQIRLEREQKIKEQIKNKELEEEKQQKIVDQLKRNYTGNWRDRDWIEKNIGKYYTWNPAYEYFWTIIGNNWKVADWKHNIKLEKDTMDQIKDITIGNLKGKNFLTRTFKNSKGYSTTIVSECFINAQKDEKKSFGGLCVNGRR